ncbi:WXG100 family type VII secretion target [Aquibacillus kalidii]|uniref:WXG100 family type VII secretion target n=1 Tax=Aquibacillus kalidii TaxID=2762597 RepID=UPI001645A9A7|nr:WXG100 family type VII secretion target [Aquibacillus kalidii]
MGRAITVDPAKLENAASKIEQQAGEYQRIYKSLFNEVDGMAAAWQGQDNMTFVSHIKEFKDDFNRMNSLMQKYSEYLRMSAKTYRETQTDIINAAKRLTN